MNMLVMRHSLHLNSVKKFVSSLWKGDYGKKGHEYLNKPAAFGCRFVSVCVTFLQRMKIMKIRIYS